jgi:hypothetical protein
MKVNASTLEETLSTNSERIGQMLNHMAYLGRRLISQWQEAVVRRSYLLGMASNQDQLQATNVFFRASIIVFCSLR